MFVRLSKILAFAFLSTLLAATSAPAAPIEDLGEAINQAGRQRMLTQRIVKAYTQILLGVERKDAQQQLHQALSLYQTQLDNLKAYASSPEVTESLSQVEQLWGPFQRAAEGEADSAGLTRLVAQNEALLAASHQVVLDLEALSTTPAGRLVNIAGRQRMLSQRMGKFYMLHAYGIRDASIRAGLFKAASEFEIALAELKSSPLNTTEINNDLNSISDYWKILQSTFETIDSGAYSSYTVAIYTEKVLQTANSVTLLYARLPTN